MDMQDYIFNMPDVMGWCDYNGGIPDRPDPIPKYILADAMSKSSNYFSNDNTDAQYVYEIVGTDIHTAPYGFMDIQNGVIATQIKQFATDTEAKDWVESFGLVFENTGLVVCQD